METSYKSQDDQNPEESVIKIYRPKDHKLKQWGLISLGGIILFFVTLFSILLSLNIFTAIQRHGRSILLSRIMPLFPLLMVGIPLAIAIILWTKNHWEDQLILAKEEIIQQKGNQRINWAYKETQRLDTAITNINFGGSIVGTKVKLLLESKDQRQWTIHNDYENMADLIEDIRNRILPDLYHQAVQKLARGEKIIFHHNMTASKEGLEITGQNIHWDEQIQTIVKNNKLILTEQEKQEPLFKSKAKKIKNLDLLLCLIENPPIFED